MIWFSANTDRDRRFAESGRIIFAVALIAFAVLQFVYGDFIPGRAPAWPSAIPGRLIWATLSGANFVGAGVAIISGKKAREAAVLSGAMIFAWALLRHLPELADPRAIVLTNTGKSLALFGGAFAVAGSFQTSGIASDSADRFNLLGRCCLGAFMVYSGIQHFIYTTFVAALIPAWIPGHYAWAYFAGVALIAGGAGLIVPRTVRLAGTLTGVMLFLWVLLLHIPRALAAADPRSIRNEWTAVFEALAMSGVAFVLASVSPRAEPSTGPLETHGAPGDSWREPPPPRERTPRLRATTDHADQRRRALPRESARARALHPGQ
jgi:uncharacterized membrane protein